MHWKLCVYGFLKAWEGSTQVPPFGNAFWGRIETYLFTCEWTSYTWLRDFWWLGLIGLKVNFSFQFRPQNWNNIKPFYGKSITARHKFRLLLSKLDHIDLFLSVSQFIKISLVLPCLKSLYSCNRLSRPYLTIN